jgi:hypothetical protein
VTLDKVQKISNLTVVVAAFCLYRTFVLTVVSGYHHYEIFLCK